MIPEKIIGEERYVSTTPTSLLVIAFPILGAFGIICIVSALVNVTDTPVGYSVLPYRGSGFVDWRLFFGGTTLMFLGFACGVTALRSISKLREKYGIKAKELKFFKWLRVPNE